MRPVYIAFAFWILSACAVFGILNCLRTEVANGETVPYRLDQNPCLFMAVILGKMIVFPLAIAETLYAFGLTGDPMAAIWSVMPQFLQ